MVLATKFFSLEAGLGPIFLADALEWDIETGRDFAGEEPLAAGLNRSGPDCCEDAHGFEGKVS